MPHKPSQLEWCLRQRNGIRRTKPSENLFKAYEEKSRDALRSMEVNAQAGILDWTISTSYYAKYFAVYAILAKIGVTSEIHDCTIELFAYLFRKEVSTHQIQDLRESKEERIEHQYYTSTKKVDTTSLSKKTKEFVLELQKLVDRLNNEKVMMLQMELKKLTIANSSRSDRQHLTALTLSEELQPASSASSPSGPANTTGDSSTSSATSRPSSSSGQQPGSHRL